MMLNIDANGRTYAVQVERDRAEPNRYRVTVDGRAHDVDAVRVGPETLSIILEGERRESFQVGFVDGREPGELTVYLGGLVVPMSLQGRHSPVRAGAAAGAGQQRVVAPMPGKVLRVLVQAGDHVAAAQPLVVVEAMKMENELSCQRPGRVKEVAVAAGTSVEAGRLLVVVE